MKSCKNCKYYNIIECVDEIDGEMKKTGDVIEECPVRCTNLDGFIVSFNGDYRPCINYKREKNEKNIN